MRKKCRLGVLWGPTEWEITEATKRQSTVKFHVEVRGERSLPEIINIDVRMKSMTRIDDGLFLIDGVIAYCYDAKKLIGLVLKGAYSPADDNGGEYEAGFNGAGCLLVICSRG